MARDLDIRLLRAFEAVVRMGGVSRAAVLLNRSQPVVSQQIRKLEALLGHALFASERSWTLTPQGELLLETARRILALNDQTFSDLGEQARHQALKIGVPEEFAADQLSIALDRFRAEWPRVPLEIEVNLSRNLLLQLHDGTLDLILAKQPRLRTGITDTVWNETLVWVSRDGQMPKPEETVPLVVFSEACLYRRSAIHALTEASRRWRIAASCTSWSGIRAAVLSGAGITVSSNALRMNGLREVTADAALPPLPAVSVILMRGPNSHTPAGDYLAQVLRTAASEGGAGARSPFRATDFVGNPTTVN